MKVLVIWIWVSRSFSSPIEIKPLTQSEMRDLDIENYRSNFNSNPPPVHYYALGDSKDLSDFHTSISEKDLTLADLRAKDKVILHYFLSLEIRLYI